VDGTVAAHLEAVRGRIRAAEARCGRPAGSVDLLAVSKLQGPDKVRAAHAAGQRAFGESYLKEALEKMEVLADLDLEWHFIGRIQGNKTRQIAARFAWLHSLCDARHARRLAEQRPSSMPPLKVCLQVNLDAEPTKAGVAPEALPELLETCAALPGLQVLGLMTLPAPAEGEAAQRAPFRALRALRDRLATPERPLRVLSMGMSADLEAAVAEGATLVRIGTAVFGPRPAA
jgi:pyridoxal phosphate enzyme (YggS family)